MLKWINSMKHLVYIHLIVIIFSAFCAYFLFYDKKEVKDPYIKVNKKVISYSDYKTELGHKPYYQTDKEFLDQFIQKEILIQEAVKKELNKNKEFTQRVKAFYEKNLVQLLMEEKFKEFDSRDIPDNLIDKYTLYSNLIFEERFPDSEKEPLLKKFSFLPEIVQYKFIYSEKKEIKYINENNVKKIFHLTDIKNNQQNEISAHKALNEIKFLRNKFLWEKWINNLKSETNIQINKR